MLWSKDVAYVRLSDANEIIAERDALKASIAELEAKLESCIMLAASLAMQAYAIDRPGLIHYLVDHPNYSDATIADVRAAIEKPNSGERRERGEK
jgi:hypothetical protein